MIEPERPYLHPHFLENRPPENVFGDLIPPPREEDLLFRGTEESQTNACINYGRPGLAYRDGYRTAARALSAQACNNSYLLDIYVYPIIYLYRHFIEMALKSIFQTAVIGLLDRKLSSADQTTLGKHDLQALWNMLRPMLAEVCKASDHSPLPTADLKGIDAYINQIHKHDPDGQRFRYAITSKAQPSLPNAPHNINIRVMASAMEILCSYLEGIENWFDELYQGRCSNS
jgi:hypothetical protein